MSGTRAILLVLILVLSLYAPLAWGSVIHVPGDQPTIQAGIDAALAGDTVLVSAGTYSGAGNRDLDLTGKAITVKSASGAEETTINCGGSASAYHRGFHFHSGEGSSSVVDGFTISGGYISYSEMMGGAIFCEQNSSPTIKNCTFTGNFAVRGAAIYCDSSSPTISNCLVTGNNSEFSGGGIECYNWATPLIENCTISENTAGSIGAGFAITYVASPVVVNCTIINNQAGEYGGGVECIDSGANFQGCIFSGNQAGLDAGAVRCAGSLLTLKNCRLSQNSAPGYGGAIMIFNADSNSSLENCLLTENTADIGGAVYTQFTNLALTNCTSSGNTATSQGGAFSFYSCAGVLTNCILWGDTAPLGTEADLTGGASLTVTYSDLAGGPAGVAVELGSTLNWGSGMLQTDPLFVAGPDGDYFLAHLAAGQPTTSPCTDSGSAPAQNICFSTVAGLVCLSELTTRTDGAPDVGTVDMGFHYPLPLAVPATGPVGMAILIAALSLACWRKKPLASQVG